MAAGLNLIPSQLMQTAMTPELQQSVHILQLSSTDLLSYLQEQVLDNPLLELEWPAKSGHSKSSDSRGAGAAADFLGQLAGRQETLEQSLISQLRLNQVDRTLLPLAIHLAGNLNENGYLTGTIAEMAADCGVPQKRMLAALAELQQLEPAGIGARDLQECLLLQIRRDPFAPIGAYAVVQNSFSLLAHGKWEEIARTLGCTAQAVQQLAVYIQQLDPYPGSRLHGEETAYIVPDAELLLEGGTWVIRWNPAIRPRLTLSGDYDSGANFENAETAAYLKAQRKSGMWLIRSVEQRYLTLERIIRAIVEAQPAFLQHGAAGLLPLNMRSVAEKLDLHESTISRAIQGKYIRLPQGTFPLKFFFSAVRLPQGEYGEAQSSMFVKAKIAELIASEDKRIPYSDEKLAAELKQLGVQVARRTVAKYREELRILSSALRKRKF